MKKIHVALLLAAIALPIGTLVVANNVQTNLHKGVADQCHHNGYHYEAKAPTENDFGWREFWACCECGQQFLIQPEEGQWEDRDYSLMTGTMTSSHIAYLAPVTHGIDGDYWLDDPFED